MEKYGVCIVTKEDLESNCSNYDFWKMISDRIYFAEKELCEKYLEEKYGNTSQLSNK